MRFGLFSTRPSHQEENSGRDSPSQSKEHLRYVSAFLIGELNQRIRFQNRNLNQKGGYKMNKATVQAMINALSNKIGKAAKAVLPKGYKILKCEGWAQAWKDRNGETIEFNLEIMTPSGQATHDQAHSLLPRFETIMLEHQVLGALKPIWNKADNTISYRCCL